MPTNDPPPGVAVVTWLRPATRLHAYLVDARCLTCERDVLHGAGEDLDNLQLGDRRVHCRCSTGHYELVDRDGILPRRVAEIRAAEAEHTARRAAMRAAR